MITDENDPQMVLAHQELLRRLGKLLKDGREPLTQALLEKMQGIITDHRAHFKKIGVDFPTLVSIVVPRLGIVEFKRADLDIASIKTSIVNFVNEHPQCSMQEIVAAFIRAWPDLKPGDVIERHDNARFASTERAKRREGYVKEAERVVREEAETKNDDPTKH